MTGSRGCKGVLSCCLSEDGSGDCLRFYVEFRIVEARVQCVGLQGFGGLCFEAPSGCGLRSGLEPGLA